MIFKVIQDIEIDKKYYVSDTIELFDIDTINDMKSLGIIEDIVLIQEPIPPIIEDVLT